VRPLRCKLWGDAVTEGCSKRELYSEKAFEGPTYPPQLPNSLLSRSAISTTIITIFSYVDFIISGASLCAAMAFTLHPNNPDTDANQSHTGYV
jgi:hypothetical protein